MNKYEVKNGNIGILKIGNGQLFCFEIMKITGILCTAKVHKNLF